MPKANRNFYRVAKWVNHTECSHPTETGRFTIGPYQYCKQTTTPDKELTTVLWKYEPYNEYVLKWANKRGIQVTYEKWARNAPTSSFHMPRPGPYEDPVLKEHAWPMRLNRTIYKYIFAFLDVDQMRWWYRFDDEIDMLEKRNFKVFQMQTKDYFIGLRQCIISRSAIIVQEHSLRTFLLTNSTARI